LYGPRRAARNGLALEVRDVRIGESLRFVAQHEAEVTFADAMSWIGWFLRDQPHDRRVAPHAEIEIARDERLDHRQCRWIVAIVDGEAGSPHPPSKRSNVLLFSM